MVHMKALSVLFNRLQLHASKDMDTYLKIRIATFNRQNLTVVSSSVAVSK
jgi:hypothetical protein